MQVFFGIVPFEEVPPLQIMWRVASGRYPSRRDNLRMSDETWGLIMHCWSRNPSDRPTMTEIVEKHLARTLLMPQSRNDNQLNQERSPHPSRSLARLVSEVWLLQSIAASWLKLLLANREGHHNESETSRPSAQTLKLTRLRQDRLSAESFLGRPA